MGWGSSTRRGGGRKLRARPRNFVFLGFRREESGMSREFCRDVPDPWRCSKSSCKKTSCAFFVPYNRESRGNASLCWLGGGVVKGHKNCEQKFFEQTGVSLHKVFPGVLRVIASNGMVVAEPFSRQPLVQTFANEQAFGIKMMQQKFPTA